MITRREFIQGIGVGGVGLAAGLGVGASVAQAHSGVGALQTFAFETITVNLRGQETSRRRHTASCFKEALSHDVAITMVAIPGGAFVMGSSAAERARLARERSQHRVSVSPFLMGQHPVTQAQWEYVARWPKVERDLHPNPAYFQGAELPVESVSWHDATEFCARLTAHTGRAYRLPSEAEWEYACRGGTTSPFHHGGTTTSWLANYVGPYTYAAEAQGVYRQTTTPAGSFAPNAFGLYDMHGNVWEWSAERWHGAYRSASVCGKSLVAGGRYHWRSMRGGSWSDPPVRLRASARAGNAADSLSRLVGMRVCCAANT
jgi:formylglycine-generating enzyme required for sulfatase activity